MSRTRKTLLGAAVALVLLLPGCGAAEETPADSAHGGDDHAAAESVNDPVDGAPEVAVNAVDIDFQPATMELAAGTPTNITVTNDGETLHDFTLEKAEVHVNVEPGASKTTSVTIDEPGTYEALCTVEGHAKAGMTIRIDVK